MSRPPLCNRSFCQRTYCHVIFNFPYNAAIVPKTQSTFDSSSDVVRFDIPESFQICRGSFLKVVFHGCSRVCTLKKTVLRPSHQKYALQNVCKKKFEIYGKTAAGCIAVTHSILSITHKHKFFLFIESENLRTQQLDGYGSTEYLKDSNVRNDFCVNEKKSESTLDTHTQYF